MYLEIDGLPFYLRHVFENRVDYVEKPFPLQEGGLILLEDVDEIVQDEIGS